MDILNNFAQENGIDVKLLQAILQVEAGDNGFGLDAVLKIRFEVHLLLDDYPGLNRWFKTEAPVYLNHYYKFPSYSTLWRKVHTGNQWDEYSALLVAAFQIQNKAFEYISMGKFQICGFHFAKLGFTSALEMFTHMSQGDDNDTSVGLRFIKSDWNLLTALQQRDIDRFIKGYNGVSGDSVSIYRDRIQSALSRLG